MKRYRFLVVAIFSLVVLSSCEEDDLPPEKRDFEVEVRLTGDIEAFSWFLALDTERDGSGFPNQFEFFPPGSSFFQQGDLEANEVTTFTAQFVDKITIQFSNTLIPPTENKTYNMSINITIRRGQIPNELEPGGFVEIGRFSKDYQLNSNSEMNTMVFTLSASTENDMIECLGDACP